MENKKWYKRTSTLFWFALATMPILITIIQTIGAYIIHWGDNVAFTDINDFFYSNNFWSIFEGNATRFGNYTPSILRTSFNGLFASFGGITLDSQVVLANIFGWFTFTYFIHLIVDIIVWLPKLFHKWLERWD